MQCAHHRVRMACHEFSDADVSTWSHGGCKIVVTLDEAFAALTVEDGANHNEE